MDIRKVGKMGRGRVKYITLPPEWIDEDDTHLSVEVLDAFNLKITKVKIPEEK